MQRPRNYIRYEGAPGWQDNRQGCCVIAMNDGTWMFPDKEFECEDANDLTKEEKQRVADAYDDFWKEVQEESAALAENAVAQEVKRLEIRKQEKELEDRLETAREENHYLD